MQSQKCLKYCPELNTLTGSITASLLLCQLEYWFDKTKSTPFYKFLEPCGHNAYKKGDSWTEELGFSKAEFRNAFNRIGKVYKTKKDYIASQDPFEGKLYLSYYDRIKKLTYYLRNTDAVHTLLTHSHCALGYYKDYAPSKSLKSLKTHKDTEKDKASAPTLAHTVLTLFKTHCPSLDSPNTLGQRTHKYLKQLTAHLVQKGLDVQATLERAFKAVESSDFLCGRQEGCTWRAYLEWMLQPDKFFAILSGKYAPFKPRRTTRSTTPHSPWAWTVSSSPVTLPLGASRSAFHRVEGHDFDLKLLESLEQARLVATYEAKSKKV
ncbi:MAG: hypothetical protein RR490_01980 [Niameybacter sp.]|uniref:hypothetical protein n=1 Tax=Niameybacter sp. TaxID=2033640 RepID=UPI002FCB2C09